MVNLSRRFKLEYEDASTGTETIAETGQDTGALQIDRHVHIRKVNNPDILKVWLDGDNFGNTIPTRLSDFATAQNGENEPEILLKQYDKDADSFKTQGRFYAKNSGTINDNGQLALKLYSFMKYTAEQSVNTGSTTTDIEAALNAVLPNGYVADVPVSSPSVNDYSLNSRREKGYQELTRNYNYALTFTSELNGNNDYKVRFEPVGQGGTVDTISQDDVTDGNDAVKFKSWQKDKTESIINKVTVEGTNSNDNKITATATNQTQIDNFGEKFRKYKVGYIEDADEATTIAEKFLVPGLDDQGNDITKVPESGTLKTVVYSDNVVNDSFAVKDDQRNIDDTYTCVQQRNYWPEGASELEFEFEQEGLEREAKGAADLRDERGRLFPSSSSNQEVGQQNFTGDTGSAPSDTSQTGQVSDAPSDTNVNGAVDFDPSDTNVNGQVNQHTNAELSTVDNFDTISGDTINSSGWSFIVNASNVGTDSLFHNVGIVISDISSASNLDIVITADDDFIIAHWSPQNVGTQNADSLTGTLGDDNYYSNSVIVMPENYTSSSVDYNLYMSTKGSANPTVDVTISAIEINHTHPDNFDTQDNDHDHGDNFDTQDLDHPHGDNFDTDDFDHGGTGDATGQHGTSGTTDSKSISIDAAQEDKTDR